MIPPAFEYLRPKTIPEAIAFLQQYGDEAKILSGGQSLIPMMKFRLARPGYLIDINRISGLSYIKEEDGFLKIGGLTREAELENSPLIHAKYPILFDTARVIAVVMGDDKIIDALHAGGDSGRQDAVRVAIIVIRITGINEHRLAGRRNVQRGFAAFDIDGIDPEILCREQRQARSEEQSQSYRHGSYQNVTFPPNCNWRGEISLSIMP